MILLFPSPFPLINFEPDKNEIHLEDIIAYVNTLELPVEVRCLTTQETFTKNDFVRFDWKLQGLLGGKGGFGAGLRAMGKTAAAKQNPSNDFSLCRDLSGNRLGAINTTLLLEKVKDSSTKLGKNDEWQLDRPKWADPLRKERKEKESKDDSEPPTTLSSKMKQPSSSITKEMKFSKSFNRELEENERITSSAVTEGLARKKMKTEEITQEIDEEVAKDDTIPKGVQIVSGNAKIKQKFGENTFLITGCSEFCTVAFSSSFGEILEADTLTEGLIQIGFAHSYSLSENMEPNLDGVGDIENSWGIDLARRVLWVDGTSQPLELERKGKVTAYLTNDSIIFEVNDRIVSTSKSSFTSSSILPVISLEQDEIVEVRFKERTQIEKTQHSTNDSTLTLESLEELGNDFLKDELKKLGLKFGGTLKEKAKRLYQAKTIKREDWPKSLFPS